jgi:hypothetical protein
MVIPAALAGADAVHDALRLLGELGREGRGTGVLRRGLLALLADDVGQVALDQLALLGVLVGGAGHEVGRQHDRVGAGLLGLVVELESHRGLGTSLHPRRHVEDLRGRLGRGADELVTDPDVRDTEVAGLAGVGVPDRVRAVLDRGHHARGLVGGLAGLDRPLADLAVGPHVLGDGAEVVGEVLRGAGLVVAVHRGDRRGRQVCVRVVLGDRRVVPRGDLVGEDPGERLGREVELVDALEVVDDRDRADVVGDLDEVAGAALGRRLDLAVLLGQRGVGAGERVAAGDELLATAPGADRVVVDHDVGVGLLEAGAPGALGGLLRAGAAAAQGAAQAALVAPGSGAGFVAGAAAGQGQGKGERSSARHERRAEGSAVHFGTPEMSDGVMLTARTLGSAGERARRRR